jgi:hypothetical protein
MARFGLSISNGRDYASLPRYLQVMDCALIPYRIDEVTLAKSPLKLY